METLNPAAGVIPGVTLAVQSCKATYNFLAPFNGGPDLLTHSKSILAQTEQALMLLNGILLKNQSESGVSKTLNAALRTTGLGSTLQSTHLLCEEFRTTLFKIIRNSTDGQSSKRDKTAMNTRDPDIRRFNEQLGDCQKRISSAVSSISFSVTANYAESDQRSISRPQAQRDLLVDLNMQPKDRKLSLKAVDGRSGELVHQAYNTDGDRNKQLLQRMKEVYKENFVTNEPTVGKQKFGDLVADDHSTAMQGIVGKPGGQIDQVFGNLTAKKHSRAFQGQMSAQAFALLFGNLD